MMNRVQLNLLLLISQAIILGLLGYLFWFELRLSFSLPRNSRIVGPLTLLVAGLLTASVLRRIKIAIFGGKYNKIQEKRQSIIGDNEDTLYSYVDSAIRGVAIEEPVFRIIPYLLIFTLGFLLDGSTLMMSSQIIAMGATSIWVSLHFDRLLETIPIGIIFYIFLVNGMILESIVAHIIINTVSFISILITEEITS